VTFKKIQLSEIAPGNSRPLYGFIRDFRGGKIPKWVVPPVCHIQKLKSLAEKGDDDLNFEVKKGLPEGITAVPITEHSRKDDKSVLEFEVSPKLYFNLHTTAFKNGHDIEYIHFTLPTREKKSDWFYQRQPAIPEKISSRLTDIMESSQWDDLTKFCDFKHFQLTYELGESNRKRGSSGVIEDVYSEAYFSEY
jgi:hypothetical protein